MKIKFFDKIKMLFSNNFEEYIRKFYTGENVSLVYKDSDYLKTSTFFACLRILAETFASCPIFEYRKNGEDRERTNDTGLYEILHDQPNSIMSAYNYLEAIMYNINLGGNAISIKMTNKYNQIVGLYPIEYTRVNIKPSSDLTSLEYEIDNKYLYKRENIFHVPNISTNGIIGMSLLEYASSILDICKSTENFLKRFYENGALPTGVFEHPSFMKEEAYQRLKESIKKEFTGLQNAGVPIILEDGMKFTQMTMKFVDAEFLANRKFNIEEICRICRVPLHMVQSLDRATHSNIEQQSLEFIMYTMLPHFKRFENCVNSQLLTKEQRKAGYYFEFNIAALIRGDIQSRYEAYSKGRQWGFLSINDIRRLENMPSIGEGGDVYLQPLNMVNVNQPTEQIDKVKKEIDDILNEKEKICHI